MNILVHSHCSVLVKIYYLKFLRDQDFLLNHTVTGRLVGR